MKKLSLLVCLIILISLSGCSSYRSSGKISQTYDTMTPRSSRIASEIEIFELNSAVQKMFEVIGKVEATVKKLTVFHKNPTKVQANKALREKAVLLGSDAVVDVQYKSGIGALTWGYIKASGKAVRYTE